MRKLQDCGLRVDRIHRTPHAWCGQLAAGAKLLIVAMRTSAVTMGLGAEREPESVFAWIVTMIFCIVLIRRITARSSREPHIPALAISRGSDQKAEVI